MLTSKNYFIEFNNLFNYLNQQTNFKENSIDTSSILIEQSFLSSTDKWNLNLLDYYNTTSNSFDIFNREFQFFYHNYFKIPLKIDWNLTRQYDFQTLVLLARDSSSILKKNDSLKITSLFLHLKYSNFSKFFMENALDTPVCFLKTKSNKRKIAYLTLMKFNNYLMIQGKKEKAFKNLTTILNFFMSYNFNKYPLFQADSRPTFIHFHKEWTLFYLTLTKYFFNNQITYENRFFLTPDEQAVQEEGLKDEQKTLYREKVLMRKFNYNSFYANIKKENDTEYFFKNFLYSKLTQFKPVFNFFVYNVDKNIKKFSRGKSGKYVFVWKYIPTYKRTSLTLNLIKKNLTFAPGLNFRQKLLNTLELIFFKFDQSFLWKSRTFIYNYIFKNFKKTLMLNFQTIK